MSEITVDTKSGSYPIYIDSEPIESLSKKIIPQDKNYLVVISERVEKLYGKSLNIPKKHKFILKDGEKEKNFKNYRRILEKAFKLKLTRQDALIAIGGGVVGDLTGFAASTYMRGIKFIQVPTTLLACTDSSVGGKTAINTKFGKNLVGCFYQPKSVYINPKFLNTLDDRQFKSGLGEVIKYAFIEKSCMCDIELTNFLQTKTQNILKRDEKTLEQLIEMCVTIKKKVVELDERESNLRRVLNFGHTLAHAIECITGYKKYTHGEAVIEGIRFVFDMALNKDLIDKNYKFFALDIIDKYGFEKLPEFNKLRLVEIMRADKKANTNSIVFVLPVDYSKVDIFELNPDELLG